MNNAQKFTLIFNHKEELAAGAVSFYFTAPGDFQYIAGQYLQMTLPHEHPDDAGTSRFFTIASAPEEPFVMITTRMVMGENPETSFKKTLDALQKGDSVQCFGPLGRFVLDRDSGQARMTR